MVRWTVVALLMAALAVPPSAAIHGSSAAARPNESEEDGEDVGARERWFYGQRAFPEEEIPSGAYLRARAQAAELPPFPTPRGRTAAPKAAAGFSWTSIGPHPIAAPPGQPENVGRVTAVALQDAQRIYVGAANGGIWRTTNAGGGWAPVFDREVTGAIGAVTVDPNNPNTVYAGTGEGNFAFDSYFGAGLFRSTNNGTTWAKLGGTTFDSCSIAQVVVEEGDPSRIGVAVVASGTPAPSSCGPSRQGVFLSTNAGATFHLVAPPPGGIFLPAGATDLTITPGAPHVWLAATNNGVVWRSTDSGQHWQPVLVITGQLSVGRVALAVSPSHPQTVAAAIVRDGGKVVQLKLSFDGGLTWPLELPTDPALCGDNGQCWYDLAIAFDPTSPTVLYLGGVLLFRYDRTSTGWTVAQIAHNLHADVHGLAFDASGLLWIGGDGGVHTWSRQSGQVVSRSQDLPITEFQPGLSGGLGLGQVVGGTQDNGTLRYTGNRRWEQLISGDGAFTVVDTLNPTTFTVLPDLDVRRSTNGGASWTKVAPKWGDGTNDKPLFYAPLVSDPGDAFTLYAGSLRLWGSTDLANNWTAKGGPFPSAVSAIASSGLTSTLTTTVYVGLSGGGVQQTTDVWASPPTWTAGQLAGGGALPARTVTDIWVNPDDSREAFASLSGFGAVHLLHTTDGVNWVNATGNLPNTPTNAVAVDSSGGFPIAYVGTDVGVFASGDTGATWLNASANLPPTAVVDVLLDPATQTLVSATHGRGAYTAPLSQAPPFAQLTAPTTLTGPLVARFNVPVRGVAAHNLVLRLGDTGTAVAAGLGCRDAAGTATDCVTGPVAVATLQPAAPLTPGQRYVADVNPPGPGNRVQDAFGTPVPWTSLVFRAAVDQEEDSAAATYTWQPVAAAGALGGSYSQHHLRKASASFGFSGTSVTWVTVAGPNQGIANVFVDGAPVGSFDHFAPAFQFDVRHTFAGLAAGRHVVQVEPSGLANASASDRFVSVDGWRVGEEGPSDDRESTYRWQAVGTGDTPPRLVARSDLAGTSVTFRFRGTGVRWLSNAGPDQGQSRVLVDGVDQGVVDDYKATAGPAVHDFLGLPDGVHALTVRVLGQKQPASGNTFVSVDGWRVP